MDLFFFRSWLISWEDLGSDISPKLLTDRSVASGLRWEPTAPYLKLAWWFFGCWCLFMEESPEIRNPQHAEGSLI